MSAQKIRLIDAGFQNFTGQFGTVDFVDGVSVEEVSTMEQLRLSSIVGVETMSGENPSPAQLIIDSQYTVMGSAPAMQTGLDAPVERVKYTREQLETIASADGISGLRKIADPLRIKGTSINKLIGDILGEHQAEPTAHSSGTAAVQVAPEPVMAT